MGRRRSSRPRRRRSGRSRTARRSPRRSGRPLRRAIKSRSRSRWRRRRRPAVFSRDNLDIIAAVQAFNELNELSDEVRNKLVADMRKSDPMSADYQGGGNLYLGIFGLMTVLVIAGGKGIFY